ncbi:hypothetical protein GCM10010124_14000 [Pilimelia terevasa]|uniref:MFS transporter n=1 Tax=Pilimelia terevasa TaxID=53372 RepID=A0A8J3BHL3_9ACTN|nr:MFS transporter [Pilimelia terevasa]GGK22675.1 hypothetical protein GCM10010124_14000 [Pilimelia terevasa]
MASPATPALGATFQIIWFGRSLSLLGGAFQVIALPLWIRHVSGSTVAGLAAFAVFALPRLVCSPFAGVLADRFDRRRLVLAADLGAFAVTASMALTADAERLPLVYGQLLLVQVLAALSLPAFMAMLPDLVPAGRLLAANSLLNASVAVAMTVGPLVGTALLAGYGIRAVIWLNAISYLVAAACLPRVPGAAGRAGGAPASRARARLREGVTALRADPVLRRTLAAEAPWYLCFGAAAELVILHFGAHAPARAPGLFGLGAGLGCMAVTATMARLRKHLPASRLLLVSVLATGPVALAAALLAAHGRQPLFAVAAGVLLGVQAYLVSLGPSLHCQVRPDPVLRGRVGAFRRTWVAGWQFAGIAAAALLSTWVPTLVLVAVGGALASAAAGPWAWRACREDPAPARPHPVPHPVAAVGGPR